MRAQGPEPYIRAADRHFAVFERLRGLLFARVARDLGVSEMALGSFEEEGFADVDAWVVRHARKAGLPIPDDPDALVDLHIELVERWAERLTG